MASTKIGDAYPTLSSVTYRYDAYGNLKEQRTSDGITARRTYGYDFSYTETGQMLSEQPLEEPYDDSPQWTMTWERDKLVRLDYIRISATDYALLVEGGSDEDATSPISAVANTPSELLWRQDIDHTYTGQKRQVLEQATGPTGFSARRVYWQYDELDRLTLEDVDSPGTANDYQTRYTLDMVGNRLSEVKIDGGGSSPTTVETTHSYRASATGYLDILTGTSSWKSAAGASQQLVEEVAFGYDLNGSMVTRTTTKPDGNGAPKQETETFSWDAAGRLTGFIADDLDPQTPADTTPDLTYTYDTQDRRSSRTTETGEGPTATTETTHWTRDESSSTGYDQILAERSDGGTPADSTDDTHTAYLQALTVVAEVSLSAAPGSLFTLTTYLVDHIGSVRAVATAGNVSFTEYDAYGTVTQGEQQNFGFQGERYEQLTKLADHRARFYDTRTGRWASYDSFEANPANPQYLHKYVFGNVNPVYYADPTGMFSLTEQGVASGVRNMIVAGTNFVSNLWRVYQTVTRTIELIDTARSIIKLLNTVSSAGNPAAAATALADELEARFGVSRRNEILTAFRKVHKIVGPHWNVIAQKIGEESGEIAARVAAGVATSLPSYLRLQAADHLQFVFYLPTGPTPEGGGDRQTDTIISVTDRLAIGVSPTGGRLFGFGVKDNRPNRPSQQRLHHQWFRIDYWDDQRLSVHYHVHGQKNKHIEDQVIWGPRRGE